LIPTLDRSPQLPVNKPQCPFHNNQFDGAMQMAKRSEEINYFPSTFDETREAEPAPSSDSHKQAEGAPVKQEIEKHDDFKQAGDHFREFDADRQERFIGRVVMKLTSPRVTDNLRNIWAGYWTQCDESLGERIKANLAEKGMPVGAVQNPVTAVGDAVGNAADCAKGAVAAMMK